MPGMDPAARLRACLDGWRLQGAGPLAGGFRSRVFACTTADGGEVVVKLTVTLAEAQAEAAALSSWAHTGAAARLLDVNVEQLPWPVTWRASVLARDCYGCDPRFRRRR
jgi:streptomycin 6-kinase